MDLVPESRECPLFLEDLRNGWQLEKIPECPWSMTIEHLNELYDLYGVGEVRNVLSLRLFASSIFEVALGPPDSQKLMYTIFGEDMIRKIATNNRQIYEAIESTTQYLAWKIRKAQILIFRRTSSNHGWQSVRKVLIAILKTESTTEKQIAGMTASILQEVAEANPKTWREDAPLLSRARFADVFRFAVLVFNDSMAECLQSSLNGEIVYEAVAARLCYFYARLVADTWRILVIRNGPKVSTEWMFVSGSLEPTKKIVPEAQKEVQKASILGFGPSEDAQNGFAVEVKEEMIDVQEKMETHIDQIIVKSEPMDEILSQSTRSGYGKKPFPNLFNDLNIAEPASLVSNNNYCGFE